MNDTLSYLCCPVENRRKCHNKLTFRGLYMAHERSIKFTADIPSASLDQVQALGFRLV